MSKSIEKLLDFEGNKISIVEDNGVYYVPVKPICDLLNVNYKHQFESIKSHKILGLLSRNYRTTGADKKQYMMLCVPERYVYGWLFSINSDSPELHVYKMKCYDVLYDHFHGFSKFVVNNVSREIEILKKVEELKEELLVSAAYKQIIELKKEKNLLVRQRKDIEVKMALGIMELDFPTTE